MLLVTLSIILNHTYYHFISVFISFCLILLSFSLVLSCSLTLVKHLSHCFPFLSVLLITLSRPLPVNLSHTFYNYLIFWLNKKGSGHYLFINEIMYILFSNDIEGENKESKITKRSELKNILKIIIVSKLF